MFGFGKIKAALQKTRALLSAGIQRIFSFRRRLDQEARDQLEATLLQCDIGVETTEDLLRRLDEAYRGREIERPEEVVDFLKGRLKEVLRGGAELSLRAAEKPPTVFLVVGVNGSGKTTSIAKLVRHFQSEGKRVVVAAGDTFRAAAVEQLDTWCSRLGARLVRKGPGADPSAVVFDACEAALAEKDDVLIVDTAGRLYTQKNLMRELEKIGKVLQRKIPGAPHETLLVLDATTGQDAVQQALRFKEAVPVTGLLLAKLDGTAKGGVVVAIRTKVGIPVKLVGTGETPEDLDAFDPDRFVEGLFS